MPDGTYDTGYYDLITEGWASGTINVLLLDTANPVYDPDHGSVADVLGSNTEASGTGYARLLVPTRTETGDRLDHGDVVWTAPDIGTVTAAVYFRDGTDDNDSAALFYRESGFPFTTDGIANLTVATGASGFADVVHRRRNRTRLVDLNSWVSMYADLAVA